MECCCQGGQSADTPRPRVDHGSGMPLTVKRHVFHANIKSMFLGKKRRQYGIANGGIHQVMRPPDHGE